MPNLLQHVIVRGIEKRDIFTSDDDSLDFVQRLFRSIGYDNERGKGDHRHINGFEYPYKFSTPLQLMLDFQADIEAYQMGEL